MYFNNYIVIFGTNQKQNNSCCITVTCAQMYLNIIYQFNELLTANPPILFIVYVSSKHFSVIGSSTKPNKTFCKALAIVTQNKTNELNYFEF